MIQSKAELLTQLQQHQAEITELGVARLGLFGSFVRDQASTTSDVDFLVEFTQEKKSFDNFINLSFLLEEMCGRRIELVTPESLSPHLGPHILREVEYVTL